MVGLVVSRRRGAGKVLGVGPLAPRSPADKVTDPKEMVARSLQSTAGRVRGALRGTVTGTIAGLAGGTVGGRGLARRHHG